MAQPIRLISRPENSLKEGPDLYKEMNLIIQPEGTHLEIVSIAPSPPHLSSSGEVTHADYQNALAIYLTNSKLLMDRYRYLLANEPPLSPEHEKWRYEKQEVIHRLTELESWFVDIDEPPPTDDGSDNYEDELRAWFDRMANKLRRHITPHCPPQIVHLIEKPTSYRVKQQRHARLMAWKLKYEELLEGIL